MSSPARLAEEVRAACLRAAAEAYEDAGLQGLCAEGRWEAALGAIRRLDLAALAEGAQRPGGTGSGSASGPGEPPSDAR